MNCAEVERELSAYLYGELAATDRRLLEEHLLACLSCRERADADRASMRLLNAWPPVDLAKDDRLADLLDRATAAHVARNTAGRRRRHIARTWWSLGAGVAAAIVLFAVLTLIGAHASYSSGTLTVAFGRGAFDRGAAESPSRDALDAHALKLRPLVSEVAVAHVDDRLEGFTAALDEIFEELDRRQEHRLLAVARSLDKRRAATVDSLDRRITEVGARLYEETRRNRAALAGAIRFANLAPQTPGRHGNRNDGSRKDEHR